MASRPLARTFSSSAARLAATARQPPKLKDASLFKQQAFVGGSWVSASSGKTFEVTDPATSKTIGSCPDFDIADTEKAIKAAVKAGPAFKKLTAFERSRMLRKWFDLMTQNKEDIATLITWENGKPTTDAMTEATYAASFMEFFAAEAIVNNGDSIPASVPGNRIVTIREPVGVCGLITPWNFPAAMLTRKMAPALAAGCTVVCKAPGETPFTSLALAELAVRAGIPEGVVNVVTTNSNTADVGKVLTTHPDIKKISFTGSTGVGKLLMKQASDTLKKASFELGGNAPFIVFADADLDLAVTGALSCKFRSSGQTCVCANRIYVQEDIYDQFVEKFVAKAKEFKLGNGFEEGVTHGPLIHEKAIGKVKEHIKDAESKGGKVVLGGKTREDLGPNFHDLTVIRDMKPSMTLASEETFGPVAGLFKFKSEAEVVKMANDSSVGLAGYFFTKDVKRVWRVAEALEVGMVGINTGIISDAASPFGGIKESGFGREGSVHGIQEYQTIKALTYGGIGDLEQ